MSKDQTLIIYHGGFTRNASTISEHVKSFVTFIDTPIILLDTAFIFSNKYFEEIEKHNITNIILHYSLFGYAPFRITQELVKFITNSNANKIAFFQDEYVNCTEKYELINKFKIKHIFTLLEEKYHKEVYLDNTNCKSVFSTLTGYVDDNLIKLAKKYKKKYEDRSCDVGYRARPLPIYLGLGAQEKTEIADKFIQHAKNTNLTMDIQTSEESRLYGEDWNKFLGNCKCMLGVQAGASIFDTNDHMKNEMEVFIKENSPISDKELWDRILRPYEKVINYRQISPRIFEAAIFRNLMILFEGKYQSVIEPDRHYIELKKDFSNIEEVIKKAQDPQVYEEITQRAYNDLILSEKYSYRLFIKDFCNKVGIKSVDKGTTNKNKVLVYPSNYKRFVLKSYSFIRTLFKANFMGREYLKSITHKVLGISNDRFLFK